MTSVTTPRLVIRPLANPRRLRTAKPAATQSAAGSAAAADAGRTDPRLAFQQWWQYAYARHQDEATRQDPRRADAHGDTHR